MIRVVHEYSTLPEGLLDDVRRLRDVVEEAELYQTLAPQETDCAVVVLCRDESQYAEVLSRLGEFPAYLQVLRDGDNEMYRRSRYQLSSERWTPVDGHEPSMEWPADGPVRILISYAVESNDSMRTATAAEIADTRREPGCLIYAWFENVELPDHLLLLELWESQRIYDLHWSGRMATTEIRGNSGRNARSPDRGERTVEFYRRQQFSLQFHRMLPLNPDHYSGSIAWTPR